MARLLYGCGLRLLECCRLRVKDVQLLRGQIVVRGGKGNKDRVVMLPRSVRADLERQLDWRRRLHERDLTRGVARVELPDALERKYPRAARRSAGSSYSPRGNCRTVRGPGAGAGITSTRPRFNEPWPRRARRPAWRSEFTATHSDTVLRPIWWNAGSIFGPSRCCWAMKVWKRR